MMEIRWDGHRKERRSYLPEILDLVAGTGRRITPVCALRAEDLRLAATPAAPHGAIHWPADTDKMGRESTVPISPTVRGALIRTLEGRGIAAGYLFPSPIDPARAVNKDLVRQWCDRRNGSPSSSHSRAVRGTPTVAGGPRPGSISRCRTSRPPAAGRAPRRCSGAISTRMTRRCSRW